MNKKREKSFQNHQESCRLCLESFRSSEGQEKLTDAIRAIFYNLTSTNLNSSEKFSNVICRNCKVDLKNFQKLREKLIQNQKDLEEFVNEEDEKPVYIEKIKCEPVEIFSIFKTEEISIKEEENNFYEDYQFSPPAPIYYEHIPKFLQCQWCDRKFSGEKSLNSHKLDKHKEKLTESEIQDIRNKKKSDRETVCPECGIVTVNLKRHIQRTHLKVWKYFCDHCHYKSFGRSKMERHMNRHKKHRALFQCDLCGKVFKRKTLIQAHMNNHRSEGPLTCCFCQKKCRNKTALWHHRKTHGKLNDQKEKCKICGKEFLISYMPKHIRTIHNGRHEEEMKLCLICGKMYKKSSFWFHQRIHTERKFICEFSGCTKKYFTASQLEQHEKTHRNQREHKCVLPGCGKSYFKQRLLRMHVSLSHENFKENCPVLNCNFSVGRKDYMKAHVSSKHTDLGEEILANLLKTIKKNPNLW